MQRQCFQLFATANVVFVTLGIHFQSHEKNAVDCCQEDHLSDRAFVNKFIIMN